MEDAPPGFDVLSSDRVTGRQRRIEVKGVMGTLTQEASVVLTARQAKDALDHDTGFRFDMWAQYAEHSAVTEDD